MKATLGGCVACRPAYSDGTPRKPLNYGAGMRYAFLPALLLAALMAGCGSSPEVVDGPEADLRLPSAPTKSQWSGYLQVMSDKERTEFLAIESNDARNAWLRRTGVDVRYELSSVLSRGMSLAAARARIAETPEDISRDGSTTTLFFSRFNTVSRTNFYLLFDNDQLVSWNSYTKDQQDREKGLLEFEARLMRKFNTVLERGMGMNAIRRQAENAQADVNRLELAYRETLSGGRGRDYKGSGQASFSDYIVAEQLLYARNRNELFSWFNNRTPDRVITQNPFETHQYHMVHKDTRGNETMVIAEFVFQSGLLESWYVYHDR